MSELAQRAAVRGLMEETRRVIDNTRISYRSSPAYHADLYDCDYIWRDGTHVWRRRCTWREAWDCSHAPGVAQSWIYFAKEGPPA